MASEPISTAFVLPTGRLGEQARRVLAVIDSVHRVGPLPRIPIDERVGVPGADGRYRFDRRRGQARGIGINRAAPHPELALLHEIGHFLDHQALGVPGRFASHRRPDLADWREAVTRSRAYELLRGIRHERELLGLDAAAVRYLLDYTELWSRSYLQYVTVKSRDAELQRQLVETSIGARPPRHLAQWSNDDFVPILGAIDALFAQKGWR